jgi:hypothetical protein
VSKSNFCCAREVDSLTGLDTGLLRERWTALYGMAPAPRISRDVLIRAVAFRLQEDAHGGLSKSCRRQLQRLAQKLRDEGSIPTSSGQAFKPGTKLIREWKGKVHEVIMVSDGYVWAGKHHRSLSQIARSITGTRWSGPRFFGVETGKPVAAAPSIKAVRKGIGAVTERAVGVADG